MEQAVKDRKRLDPARTRETILCSAFETFAQKGYDGASIADIARAAGVPKSLVQYHFGAKEELWEACLAARATPMMQAVDKFLSGESSNPGELIEARFRFIKGNPELRRLLSWAGLSSTPIPHFIQDRRKKVLEKIGGDPESDRFARLAVALAATDGLFQFRFFYRAIFGDAVDDEAFERKFLQVLTEVVSEK